VDLVGQQLRLELLVVFGRFVLRHFAFVNFLRLGVLSLEASLLG